MKNFNKVTSGKWRVTRTGAPAVSRGWGSSVSRVYAAGGDEFNAKAQRRKGAKWMKSGLSCSLNSDRNRPAGKTIFPCVFASLRLCVENLLNSCGLSLFREMPSGNSAGSAYNIIHIDRLTGRAVLEFQKVQ